VLQNVTGCPSEFDGEIEVFHYLSDVLDVGRVFMRSINFV
jgi:hypothetical protein